MADHAEAMMHLIRGLVGSQRNAVSLGIVSAVNDAGQAQVVNLSTGDGVDRADVEVAWPWGISANPPLDGAITLVVKIGDDPGNLMALPPANPSARYGGLPVGAAVIYAGDGTRVLVKPGGVEIWGAALTLNVTNTTINGNLTVTGTLTGLDGETLTGNEAVTGNITATGSITPDV